MAYHGDSTSYLLDLRELLPDSIALCTGLRNFVHLSTLGANATQHPLNAIPRLVQGLADGLLSNDLAAVTESNRILEHFNKVAGGMRAMKASLKVLGLGNGVMRPPYLPLSPADEQRLASALEQLRIRELEGISEPAAVSPV